MRTKTFDCIQMKRAAQKKIREAVAGMDRRGEIEYFRAGIADFEQRVQAAKEAHQRSNPTNES